MGHDRNIFYGDRPDYKVSAQSQNHMEGGDINIGITDAPPSKFLILLWTTKLIFKFIYPFKKT